MVTHTLLCIKVPTVAEHIKLEMYDWDRMTENDLISTHYLNIHHISEMGLRGWLVYVD